MEDTSLCQHAEPARVQAFAMESQVIESIAKEHDTTSQSHSASSPTRNGMLSNPVHLGPGKTPSALERRGNSRPWPSKQRSDLASHTYTVPSKPRYKVIHGSIHNLGYYPLWLLLLLGGETRGEPVGSDDMQSLLIRSTFTSS